MYVLKTVMYSLDRVFSKAVPKTLFELWTNRTPSIRHLYVWGCQAEIRMYNLQKRKLDVRTMSRYFICYPEKSKRCMFYCPNHSIRIVKSGNVRFIENGEISGSIVPREVKIKEVRVQIPLVCTSSSKLIALLVIVTNNNEEVKGPDSPVLTIGHPAHVSHTQGIQTSTIRGSLDPRHMSLTRKPPAGP